MKCDRESMLLYAITDRTWLSGRSLCEDVEKALEGGVSMLQLREKELDDEAFLKEAMEIKDICKKYNIPFIINDNVEIAIKCDADGVHVGQNDMILEDVRAKLGENKIIGISAQTVEQAILAEKGGANYLGVGAVFSTSTKEDADYVEYETLKEMCNNVSIPVCAIGGIYDTNIHKLKGSGIDGVALISAIFAAKDIKTECEKLRVLSEKMVRA